MYRVIGFLMTTLWMLASTAHAAVPALMTVQGKLTDASGAPLPPGFKLLTFKIYDAQAGGVEVWPVAANEEDHFLNTDANGLWSTAIGSAFPLTHGVFADTSRWLEVTVNDGVSPPVTLPRTKLNTGPFANRVATVDGASGGAISSTVSIGSGHVNTGINAFVAGENNVVSGNRSTITGGRENLVNDSLAFIGGGRNNQASGRFSAVAGGDSNFVSAQSFIGAGRRNSALGGTSVVGGGTFNMTTENLTVVGGGTSNTAGGILAVIGGGSGNVASGFASTVGGGGKNYALGLFSTISGGGGPGASDSNLASGERSTIAGGFSNSATGLASAVNGGRNNRARGAYATVSGGGGATAADSNSAAGRQATVPGGTRNHANGNYSFAAGRRARALHGGTFVWGDSTDADISSTGANQFLIRASGGVGIGTNSPDAALHVQDGSAGAIAGNANAAAVFERNGDAWLHIFSPDANQRGILFGSPANDLMGSIRFNPSGNKGYEFRGRNNQILMTLDSLGNLSSTGTCCPSDARFKRDVETIPDALGMVEHLRGVRYMWQREKFDDRNFPDGQQVGLIAQEVREVVPQAVVEQSDGYLAVDYARLVPLLIESIKEQQKQIEELKAAIKDKDL